MADLKTIQALRAAACLLVVAYHAIEGSWLNGAAGVDLFFVISGLVMGLSSPPLMDWRVFAFRRLRRLVPLYWGLTALKLAIGLALPATLAATRPGIWNIAASFLFIPARDGAGMVRPVLGVGWTLQFEMLFYAVFALALAVRRPPIRIVLPLLLPLAIAGFWRQPDWPAPLSLANGLVVEFCLGLLLAGWIPALSRMDRRAAWCLVLSGGTALLALPSCGAWRFLCWGVPAVCVVAGATGLEQSLRHRLPRPLLALGDASFAIYLLHPFLTPVLARIWHRGGFGGEAGLIVASLVICGTAGWLLHDQVDRRIQAILRRRASAPMPLRGQLVQP